MATAAPSTPPPAGFAVLDLPGGFEALTGPLYVADGGTRFAFRAGSQHTNPDGAVHGGMLMSFMDAVLALTLLGALETRAPVATVSFACDFLSPARPGDWIEGAGELTGRTRSLAFLSGRLTTGERGVLSARAVWRLPSAR